MLPLCSLLQCNFIQFQPFLAVHCGTLAAIVLSQKLYRSGVTTQRSWRIICLLNVACPRGVASDQRPNETIHHRIRPNSPQITAHCRPLNARNEQNCLISAYQHRAQCLIQEYIRPRPQPTRTHIGRKGDWICPDNFTARGVCVRTVPQITET